MSQASPVAVLTPSVSSKSLPVTPKEAKLPLPIFDEDGDSVMDKDDEVDICEEDTKEASHMEADEDEDDPEMIECPLCGTMTHVSVKSCKNPDCTFKFQFTDTGHYKDGFVCSEDEIEYDDEASSSDEETEFDSDEEESSDAYENDSPSPWCKDEDEDWEP